MPIIQRDFWNGDDPKWDYWYDNAINNMTRDDHEEILFRFKQFDPEFCERCTLLKVDIKDTNDYREFLDDQLAIEYESLD
tara:strand:- start:17 stop:256 length:240 start_codon:yes stop_codon:yes gene_type:complete